MLKVISREQKQKAVDTFFNELSESNLSSRISGVIFGPHVVRTDFGYEVCIATHFRKVGTNMFVPESVK